MNLNQIDLTSVEVKAPGEFMAIPAGKYRVMVTEAEYKATAAGTGHRIALQLTIVAGEHKGRLLFEGLNVDNPNEVAQQIGRQRLAEICDALQIGRGDLNDVGQIEGQTLVANVTRTASKDPKYGDSNGYTNSVNRFEADLIAAQASRPKQQAATAQPSAAEESPW